MKNTRDGTDYKLIIKKTADIFPTAESFEINRIIPMEEEEEMMARTPPPPGQQPRKLRDKSNDFIRLLNIVFKK